MPEMCQTEPARECRSATRLAMLEKRVDDLEKGQKKEEKFRKDFYSDREARIQRDAHLDEQIKSMDDKLGDVKEWVDTQKQKPTKLLDGLVEKAMWAVVGALIAFALAQIGL